MCTHAAFPHWAQHGGHDHSKGFGEGGEEGGAGEDGKQTGSVVQDAVTKRCLQASWLLELPRYNLWTALVLGRCLYVLHTLL